MPEKIKLADGSEREVLTADEQKALQEKANKADELGNKIKEVEEEDKNWPQVREHVKFSKNVKKNLEAQGFEFDKDGNIKKKEGAAPPPVNTDEIVAKAREAGVQGAEETLFSENKEKLLGGLHKDTRSAVEYFYKEMTEGKTGLTTAKKKELLEAAFRAANVPVPKQSGPVIQGGTPRSEDGKAYGDSEDGQKIANQIFGEESFAKPKK